MNERIKELAEQARDWAEVSYKKQNDQFTSHWDNPIGYTVSQFFEQKFAELIVAECAVYCAGHILPTKTAEENDLNYNDGVMDCAIGLYKHFGVEE